MTEQPNSNEPSDVVSATQSGESLDVSAPVRTRKKYRLGRLVLKELRETLRDRRTIVTLLLMPLLVYPALSLVFKTYLLSNVGLIAEDKPVQLIIAFSGDTDDEDIGQGLSMIAGGINRTEQIESEELRKQTAGNHADAELADSNLLHAESGSTDRVKAKPKPRRFVRFSQHKQYFVSPNDSTETLESRVESGMADVGVFLSRKGREKWEIGEIRLVSRNDPISQMAREYVEARLAALNQLELKRRLALSGQPVGPLLPMAGASVVGPEEEHQAGFPLASLVPLVLVLMTITGAVYPAIDLTAGERERGTLETLMAAPVPRFGILFSKFVAVLTVAVLTAILNLLGMFATVWAFQLDKQFGVGVFNFSVMLQILLLLVLFAAFFSALLLAVTSFAKSFKEAQVYLIPIILLSLGPGLMAMAPGMSLNGVYAVVPMINILLLARDVILTEVQLIPAIVTVVSTLIYSYLALRWAAWIFGSDGVLSAGHGNFAEMFQRPAKVNRTVPIFATLFCLVLLFPINFVSLGFVGRLSAETPADLQYRYLLMGLFIFIAFMFVPWVVARHQNTDIKSGFGLNLPKPIFLVAAVLLGLGLWTIVMSLTSGWHSVYGYLFGFEAQAEWSNRLIEVTSGQIDRIRKISPWMILLCFSIIPAICEEWFFRGMLFRSLLKTNSVLKAILISAVVFGVFHTLSTSAIAIDRLIPTTLVGVILGYLAYKSDSIVPGVVLHCIHNAIVIFLGYFAPQLSEFGLLSGNDDSVPLQWVLVGCLVTALGIALVHWSKRPAEVQPLQQPESPSVAEVV